MNKEEVLEKLKTVIYPGFEKSIVDFGFVKNIEIGDEVLVEVEIVSSKPEVADKLRVDITKVLGKNAQVIIKQPKIPEEKSNTQSGKNIAPQIKHFVMVSSGKGGVGKSTTTVNLAISMAKLGKKVGVLDADIYGPNIPRMLGEQNTQPTVVGQTLKPILTHGIEMMSMGVLIEEGQGLMWRGAMIMKAIEQLLRDVGWSDLDVLFIDMPPGTGDAQITLAQSVPVTAGVCVTTPQIVALDDTARSLDMFEKLHIPIAGIVENMSGFICPDNAKEYDIFGKGGSAKLASKYKTEILGEIPIEISIREGGDSGKPISFYEPNSVSSKRYEGAANRLWEIIEKIDADELADNSAIQPDNSGKAHCHS
ncbi:Mrp/NBP35 family ATP-binding protein [Campylobacter geochelonis]|uniref:Iron-sulfur cluster carrier protein n=1 Tax=Campylobacter geochelonis TaxID=1780362 RepID=A0A128EH72_9BACT|nr:Mrp/NBP35 family ATP-binding protein [Campylobacter geochelonis]QKF71745.1 ATP/GTP-binding protein [Campylobacter geochelonis]CZE47603.1 cytochrome C oxidase heme b and copper-binding subunit%2C membrane-bound [Campylobacter geochelonis]CZE48527.1 cytochrome C oxidase heme b and copper-binding subunit%2C membrane-bound [Campylobacter geochelonis]CZE51164.1 cytochrome C oxidase heme b and copper-binding subunit%2C membrane-bound [Campylobacter geochelonis]